MLLKIRRLWKFEMRVHIASHQQHTCYPMMPPFFDMMFPQPSLRLFQGWGLVDWAAIRQLNKTVLVSDYVLQVPPLLGTGVTE